MTSNKMIPNVLWAQRQDKLYLTIEVDGCKDVSIKFEDNTLHFSGMSGLKVNYDFTIEFFNQIDPEKSKYAVSSRHIPMVIVKKDGSGPYWPRLLKDKTKVHWLKTDFEKWRDEDDSEGEESNSKDMQFENMMNMGDYANGMPGMPGGDDDEFGGGEEDSDDEEEPPAPLTEQLPTLTEQPPPLTTE